MKLILIMLMPLLFSCYNKTAPKNISFSSALGFLGSPPEQIGSFLNGTEYSFSSEGMKNGDYLHSYLWVKGDIMDLVYIQFDKCNDADKICRVKYSITADEYSNTIPAYLKSNGYRLLDTDDKGKTQLANYLKDVSHDVFISLAKTKYSGKDIFSVDIASIKIPSR